MKTETTSAVAPSVELLRSAGSSTYIMALARSFPCLRHKMDMLFPEGRRKWDVDVLMEASAPWSHGEKLCALFVANVWNPGYADTMEWRFDVFEFLGCADNGNRRALIAWLTNPVWP